MCISIFHFCSKFISGGLWILAFTVPVPNKTRYCSNPSVPAFSALPLFGTHCTSAWVYPSLVIALHSPSLLPLPLSLPLIFSLLSPMSILVRESSISTYTAIARACRTRASTIFRPLRPRTLVITGFLAQNSFFTTTTSTTTSTTSKILTTEKSRAKMAPLDEFYKQ